MLAPLATMTFASSIDGTIQRKIRGSGAGVVRAGISIVLLIQNEDMDGITRTIKSL